MRTFTIFNGTRTVEVNKDLVEIFEQVQGPLTDVYVELICVVYDITKDTPDSIATKIVSDALIEEVQVVCQVLDTFPAFLEEMGIE